MNSTSARIHKLRFGLCRLIFILSVSSAVCASAPRRLCVQVPPIADARAQGRQDANLAREQKTRQDRGRSPSGASIVRWIQGDGQVVVFRASSLYGMLQNGQASGFAPPFARHKIPQKGHFVKFWRRACNGTFDLHRLRPGLVGRRGRSLRPGRDWPQTAPRFAPQQAGPGKSRRLSRVRRSPGECATKVVGNDEAKVIGRRSWGNSHAATEPKS